MNRNLFISFAILCLFFILFLPILAFLIKPAKMQPGTWIVTSTADSGPGTLRSCLANAATGDTVTFDSSVFPPTSPVYINLTSELPHIAQRNLIIDASGAGVILNGNHTLADTVGLVVDSENNTIKGLQILHFPGCGIRLTANSRACSISRNKITNNDYGIWLSQSSNNSISRNDIANNTYGIWFQYSSNNTISGNNITNNYFGIFLWLSFNNSISENNIAENINGIAFAGSNNNTISGNSIISNNGSGIYLGGAFNKFYHNNFINNTEQVDFYVSNRTNFWNTTYFWNGTHVSGGNYWSDYTDVDQYSGPYQNKTGSDGIWDHPYVIDENNIDNYPIVPEFPSFLILPLFMITTLLAVSLLLIQ